MAEMPKPWMELHKHFLQCAEVFAEEDKEHTEWNKNALEEYCHQLTASIEKFSEINKKTMEDAVQSWLVNTTKNELEAKQKELECISRYKKRSSEYIYFISLQ
jgi:hypothetical protein